MQVSAEYVVKNKTALFLPIRAAEIPPESHRGVKPFGGWSSRAHPVPSTKRLPRRKLLTWNS